jgi:hypothetical protein
MSGSEEVKRQIEAAELPLSFLLREVVTASTDKKIRDYIFTIAFQDFSRGDLSQKDIILNQLHKALKPFGIERNTLSKEFKQFMKEQESQIVSMTTLDTTRLRDNEKQLIDELTGSFGLPIPFDHNGKAKGINQMFFANKFSLERKILYEPVEHAFHEYHPNSGLWIYKMDEKVKIEIGHSV